MESEYSRIVGVRGGATPCSINIFMLFVPNKRVGYLSAASAFASSSDKS